MNSILYPIRAVFVLICAVAGWLVAYAVEEWDDRRVVAVIVATLIGILVVLVDMLLKGFSLRGLSAVTFGLAVGSLIAYLVGISPLFDYGDPGTIHLSRLGLFIVVTYLCTVIALRGRDEFNLVIPYVRFVPHEVETPLVVVDTSALIDGRIVPICESGFLHAALILPRFVINELQRIADSPDPPRQVRGRRGMETLARLRGIQGIEVRIEESDARRDEIDAKLVFLAQSMRARLLTTDYNLAKLAEFHGVGWLNLSVLVRALRPGLLQGDTVEVELVKPGKESGQAVGYLSDGSMVVVDEGRASIGKWVAAEIVSVLPSAGGRMIFARYQTSVPPEGGGGDERG
jgi:uncharacterized protein YacL